MQEKPQQPSSSASDWPAFDAEAVELKLNHLDNARMKRAIIQQEKEHHAQRLVQHHVDQRSAYLKRAEIPDFRYQIEQEAENALSELSTIVNRAKASLSELRVDLENKRQDYYNFREANQLKREPHYPDSVFRHIVILILIGLIETGLNGSMLAVGAEGGYVQGWGIALSIAVVNLGMAFACGNLCRLVNSPRLPVRAAGIASGVIGGLLVVMFNLFVAHYRSALTASTEYGASLEAGTRAWETFSTSFSNIPDFMSWLLAGFGILAAGYAGYKGYSLADPFPGYSRRHKAFMAAQGVFNDENHDVIEEISKFQDKTLKSLDQYLHNLQIRLTTARNATLMSSELVETHRVEQARLAARVEYLHTKYCPDEQPISMDFPSPDRFSSNGATPGAEGHDSPAQLGDLDAVAEMARSYKSEISTRCSEALDELRSVEQLPRS